MADRIPIFMLDPEGATDGDGPVYDAATGRVVWAAGGSGSTDPEVVRDTIAAALVAGTNVTITVNDAADTITIAATGTTDPEIVRDTIAAALVAGTGVSITPNDAGDTITISATGGGGGTATLASDTFTRADSTTSLGTADSGGAWTLLGGPVWGIASNKARVVSGSAATIACLDVGQSDQDVVARITGSTNDEGVAARVTDINNFYVADLSSGLRLLKRVAGTYTTLAATTTLPIGASRTAGIDLRLRCSGDRVTVYVNGVAWVSVIDSAVPLGTKAGLWQGTVATAPRWDDFVVKTPS